ncbi:unnamed protein product [Toxocara canis]|uniref:Uncharacterized protein n=1 Tax=Toxocara canis TaxID=6265 RepID=A0A183V156_TOXCA|nr:unnamed protein product [Toxocara canis]
MGEQVASGRAKAMQSNAPIAYTNAAVTERDGRTEFLPANETIYREDGVRRRSLDESVVTGCSDPLCSTRLPDSPKPNQCYSARVVATVSLAIIRIGHFYQFVSSVFIRLN